jgi:hypothetical protein
MNDGVADGSNSSNTTLTDYAGTNNGTLQNFNLSGSSSNWTYGQNLSQTVYDTVVATACSQYMIPDSSGYWDATGTYSWTFNQVSGASAGCDSIVTYDLTIDTVDTRTSVNGIVLSALATNATYQWVNCGDSSMISGANSATYVASANGDYAALITQGNCTEWTDCISVTTIGLEERSPNGVVVYPNPSKGTVHILHVEEGVKMEILDVYGRKVGEFAIENGTIELPTHLVNGMYVLRSAALESPLKLQLLR